MNNNANNNMNNNPQIVGYNPQTGEPIYVTNNVNSNPQVVGYNPQTGAPIYGANNINNQTQVQNVRYATLGERIIAVLRDWLHIWWWAVIWFFLIQIIQIMIRFSTGAELNETLNTVFAFLKIFVTMMFVIIAQPFYAMFADASSKHASIGKRKQNIVVLDKKGNYLSGGQSFLRLLLKMYIPGNLLISLITISCTEKKQALHDLILGHVVVKNK